MGIIDFYGIIYIKRRQTSMKKIAYTNAIVNCEQALNLSLDDFKEYACCISHDDDGD